VRGAFDVILGTELATTMPAVVRGRRSELSPYLQAMFAEQSGFEPDWGRYFDASARLARCEYASALGLPAACVPVLRAEGSGLPVGVQLIGARGSERSLRALASELESALGG